VVTEQPVAYVALNRGIQYSSRARRFCSLSSRQACHRVAPTAYPLPKNNLALIRHPGRQVGWTRTTVHGRVRPSGADLMATFYKVAKLGSRRSSGGIPESFSTFRNNLHHSATFQMIDREMCAFRRR
jgi:hypothetical protein